MRYVSGNDSRYMRKRANGPAVMMTRRNVPIVIPGRGLSGLHGTSPRFTPQFRKTQFQGFAGTTGTAVSGAATGAAAGTAIMPGIGTAVGAVVGAIGGLLFGGKSNPQIQIDKTSAINFFSQYTAVAGTVSGRSIGLNNMDMVLRGACFEGHFPKWGNSTELPDSLLSMPGSPYGNNDNCFAVLWRAASTGAKAPGSSGKNTGTGYPVRDAKIFVDYYVWPSNTADVDTDPWVTTTDAIGKQIIYDCADAYLAVQDPTTNVLVGQMVQKSAANLPAVTNTPPTASPTPSPVPAVATPAVSVTAPANYSTTPWSTITPGQTSGLATSYGVWFFAGASDANGNTTIYVANGAGRAGQNVGGAGIGALIDSAGKLYLKNSQGTWFNWNGQTWVATTAPQIPSNTTPTTSTAPPAIGGQISTALDSVTGAMMALPSGATYGGLTPQGAWIINFQGALYTLQSGVLAYYTPSATSSTGVAVSTTIPAMGTPITTLKDNTTGQMVTIPPGGVYAGLTSTNGWLVTYPAGGAVPAGTYDSNAGQLQLQTPTQTGSVIPTGYTPTTQSVLVSGQPYPLYTDTSGNSYVWYGGAMVPYTVSGASGTTSTTSGGGGGYFPSVGGGSFSTPDTSTLPGTTTVAATGSVDTNTILMVGVAALGLFLLTKK